MDEFQKVKKRKNSKANSEEHIVLPPSKYQKDGLKALENRITEFSDCLLLFDDKLHCTYCDKAVSSHRSHCIAHLKTAEHLKNKEIFNKKNNNEHSSTNAPYADFVSKATNTSGRKLEPFQLEMFFAKHEFTATYLLCCSDCETLTMKELLSMADSYCTSLWDNLRLGYTETKGLPALREQCSLLYDGFDGNNILCFAGAEEGIFCTIQTILKPMGPDVRNAKALHVIIVTPCYQSLLSIPASLSFTVTTVPLVLAAKHQSLPHSHNTSTQEWELNFAMLKEAIKPGQTKLLVVNFPHNPTGAILTLAQQQEIVNMAREHNFWIFSDEVYRGFGSVHLDNERPNRDDSVPFCTLYPKAISLGAMSKVYGMPGVRVGWVACQDRQLLARISESKHYLSICNSAPSEILALIALRSRDTILTRNKRIVQYNMELVESFLSRHPNDFSWVPPRGGCCGFVRYHKASPTNTLNTMMKSLVGRFGVLILPGDNFPLHIRTQPNSSQSTEGQAITDSDAINLPLYAVIGNNEDDNSNDCPSPTQYQMQSDSINAIKSSHDETEQAGINNFFRVGLGRATFVDALRAFENALPFLDE